MSVRVMSLVWDSDVPAPARLTLLALADRADEDGVCWPSISTLARKCRTGESTVRRHLKELESCGVLAVEHRVNTSSMYRIDLDRLRNPPQSDTPPQIDTPSQSDTPSQTEQDPPPNLSGTPSQSEHLSISYPSVEPPLFDVGPVSRPSRQPKPRRERESEPAGFAEFYDAYPRHEARRAAAKAFPAAVKRAGSTTLLVEAAKRYAAQRQGEDPKFTPLPATWLNQDRYRDERVHLRPVSGHVDGRGVLVERNW